MTPIVASRTGLGRRLAALGLIAAAVAAAVLVPPPRAGRPPLRITGEIQHFTPARNPRPVPEAVFADGTGRPVAFADFRGRVVLLNFWATWCAPCVREMPALDRLQKQLGDSRFAVVALNEDRNGAEVAPPFMDRLGLSALALYLDPGGAVQRAFGVTSLPTTILIDARGREVGRLVGPAEWTAPEAVALIRHFVDEERR
jgi:thiol-disulfide isomerase/thioredoxin